MLQKSLFKVQVIDLSQKNLFSTVLSYGMDEFNGVSQNNLPLLFQYEWNMISSTTRKMKFSINDFLSKCEQIRSLLRIRSHSLKKFLKKTLFFVEYNQRISFEIFSTCRYYKKIYFANWNFHLQMMLFLEFVEMWICRTHVL